MARRPGRHRLDHSSPLVDLDDVFADDALIDDIAASPWGPAAKHRFGPGRSPDRGAPGVLLDTDPVTDLFTTWREELAERPMPALPTLPAVAHLDRVPVHPVRKYRSALSVAAAIAALLVGSTFVGSKDAVPGSPMWGITEVLWPDRAQSVASRSEVRSALEEAQTLIDAGHPADAQLALLRASVELGNVDDVDGRGEMEQQLATLWVQTGATAPTADQTATTSSASASTTTSPTPSLTSSVPPRVPELAVSQLADAAAPAVLPSNPQALVLLAPAPATSVNASGQAAAGDPGSTAAPASPATDSAGATAPVDPSPSSPAATDPSVTPSAPSTVPVPTAPIVPVTPSATAGETTSQIAPAQTGPMPTPSLPGPATVDGESTAGAAEAAAQAIQSVLSVQAAILTGGPTGP